MSASNRIVLKYTKRPEAYCLRRGSPQAAGYDLTSIVDVTVPARGMADVMFGIRVELPEGCYGRIAPRSGLAFKHSIDVLAGVIDRDFRGELSALLVNHSDQPLHVKKGQRVAQLICERIYEAELEEVQELSSTERGERGCGSTGTH